MTLWFFRLTVVFLSPVIGWYKVSSDWRGIAVLGLAEAGRGPEGQREEEYFCIHVVLFF